MSEIESSDTPTPQNPASEDAVPQTTEASTAPEAPFAADAHAAPHLAEHHVAEPAAGAVPGAVAEADAAPQLAEPSVATGVPAQPQPHTSNTAYPPTHPGPYAQATVPGPAAGGDGAGHLPPTFAAAPEHAPAPKQRSMATPILAAAVVAALLGGGAGAGVAAWVIGSQASEHSTSAGASPQTITVNNPDSVDAVTAIAAKAGPSVVTISVSAGQSAGTGSGVILSADGYVLTNTHVATLDGESADGKIEVTTADGRIFSASVVGLDPIVDLAVLKLNGASGLTPVEWGDSTKLNVGDRVVAIGAPLGLANTVTDGIVSALNRSIQIQSSAVPNSGNTDQNPDQQQNGGQGPFDFWNFDQGQGGSGGSSSATSTISLPVIQTDAAINPGNSGGALVDSEGRVVGINVAIASTGGSSSGSQSGSIGVGFSIPSSLAQRVAKEIVAGGKATHGLLGASVTSATASDSDVVGAVIKEVVSGGAADKAGLKVGDVITSFDGVPITSSTDLTAQVRALAAGASTELVYQRNGKATTTQVTLGTLQL